MPRRTLVVEMDSDADNNVAYIRFSDASDGVGVESVPIDDQDGTTVAVVDFASSGQLIGIELLDATRQLPR